MPAKTYILVRDDLPPGQQAVQAAHAAFRFAHHHRSETAEWLDSSEYLVLLQVHDEAELHRYARLAILRGISTHVQCEPDLDGAATAIALGPGERTSQLCAQLPLALNEEPAML